MRANIRSRAPVFDLWKVAFSHSCLSKKCYSRGEADRVAMGRNRHLTPGECLFNAYHCKNCGSWHCGHVPKK